MPTVEELEKALSDEKAKNADNIKALQQKLTEADKSKRELEKKIGEIDVPDNNKTIIDLTKQIENLTGQINNINDNAKIKELSTKYPEIAPELLLGKSDEDIEKIVEKQKSINAEIIKNSPSDHSPIFSSVNEIDDEIERIKNDRQSSTEIKLTKIRQLKEAKENFN